MEPTLEWLFKLHLLGLIRGVIDGKGMIEAVWKSASSGKDAVDLAVLKVLLSEVRSPVVEVQNGSKCDGKTGNDQYEFQMQYGSIGWSVGATLGYAQGAKDKRVIACIGDGSFQVTAQDVSTMIRCGQRSIIFLINNGGYTIEVEIHNGPYNVIKNWDYTALINAIHNGEGKCWTAKFGDKKTYSQVEFDEIRRE